MGEFDAIQKNNFKFSKKFGQNFIFDKNLLNALIDGCDINKDDEILEIGPGAGTLTNVIAGKCKRVVSYEIDTALRDVLAENLKSASNSTIIFADALKTSMEEIESNFKGKYKIVANLPYYITTPLIFKFVGKTQKCESMNIMVQKEVAERLVAKCDDDNYGTISTILDFYGDVKVLRQVPRQMFVPAPNVDSAFVQIKFVSNKFDANPEFFEKVVKLAFSNRRKTLANNLAGQFGLSKQQIMELLVNAGYSESVRGDSLGTADFVKLTNLLTK